MNVFLSYLLRNLGRRRLRTFLGALGTLVTIALLTAMQAGLDSISLSYIDLVEYEAGRADLLLSRSGSDYFNPQSFAVSDIAPSLSGHPDLLGFSPRVCGVVVVQSRGEEQQALLVGVDLAAERKLGVSGVAAEAVLAPGGCLLSQALADKLKLKSGDRLFARGMTSYSEAQCKISGILKKQFLLPQQIRDYVVVDLRTGQTVFGEADSVHYVAGALRHPRAFYDARDLHGSVLRLKNIGARIAAKLGARYEVRLPKAEAISHFQEVASPLRAFFGVFALLVLTITALLIYSLVSVGVDERIREYGILRTLGARRSGVFGLVLGESALLCAFGILPGILVGLLFAKLLLALFVLASGVPGFSLPLSVTPFAIGLIALAGILLSTGSAAIPALRATRWRIVDALDPLRRGQINPPPPEETAGDRSLMMVGLVLSAISIVVFFVLPNALFSGNPSVIGTLVLCMLMTIVLGFTLTAMGFLPWVQRLLLAVLAPVLGPLSELVGRNLGRHRRRHTTTALLFTLSVAFVLFIASVVALFSRSAMALVEQTVGADLRIHALSDADPGTLTSLQQIKGVDAVSRARFLRNRTESGVAYDVVITDLVGMKQLWVVPFGVDTNLARILYRDGIVMQSGPPAAFSSLAAARADSASTNSLPPVILSLSVARFLEVQPGDPVRLSFHMGAEKKEGRFIVSAVCRSLPGFGNFRGRIALAVGSGVLIPDSEFHRLTTFVPEDAFQALYFVKTSGDAALQKEVARHARDDLDIRYRFGVQSAAEQKEGALAVYWGTQIFFGFVLAVAVVLAVFALIASMAGTVIERRREIGVLKALGLRRGDLLKIFFGEAVTITISSGILGGAIGFALAWLFVTQAAALIEAAVSFTMPYLTLTATLLVSLVAGWLAAYIPARSILRQTAAEILRG